MANALKTLFTNCADAIRETLPDVGKMSPNSFPDKIREVAQAGGGSGGDTSDLVKWVEFRSGDGKNTLLYEMPVLNGDTCKDPIHHRDISTPNYENDTHQYIHAGWLPSVGASSNADVHILEYIKEDKTVYSLMREIPKTIEFSYSSIYGCYRYETGAFLLLKDKKYSVEWDGTLYEDLTCTSYYGELAGGSITYNCLYSLGNPTIITQVYNNPFEWTNEIKTSVKSLPFFISANVDNSTGFICSTTGGSHTVKIIFH